MAIKILSSITPSDNGNEFLCLSCSHGAQRSGTSSNREVCCRMATFGGRNMPVKFVVTQCDEYESKLLQPEDNKYQKLKKEAWMVDASTEGKGLVIIPPDEYARRHPYD
jgi:hypothetical protein